MAQRKPRRPGRRRERDTDRLSPEQYLARLMKAMRAMEAQAAGGPVSGAVLVTHDQAIGSVFPAESVDPVVRNFGEIMQTDAGLPGGREVLLAQLPGFVAHHIAQGGDPESWTDFVMRSVAYLVMTSRDLPEADKDRIRRGGATAWIALDPAGASYAVVANGVLPDGLIEKMCGATLH